MTESDKRESGIEWPFIEIDAAANEREAVRRVSAIGNDVRVAVVKVSSAGIGGWDKLTEAVNGLTIPVILLLDVDNGLFPLAIINAFDLCFAAEASDILVNMETVPAREAERRGLINHAGTADEIESLAMRCARTIAGLAPLAVKHAKRAVRKGASGPLENGLALENILFANLFATSDMREGTAAFLEKRPPVFRGE